MAHRSKFRQSSMRDLLSKIAGQIIPIEAIKYARYSQFEKTRVFSLCMPITGQFQDFKLSDYDYNKKVVTGEICDILDYYKFAKSLINIARDFQSMTGDLKPITREERQVFNVREIQPNACLPQKPLTFLNFKRFEH